MTARLMVHSADVKRWEIQMHTMCLYERTIEAVDSMPELRVYIDEQTYMTTIVEHLSTDFLVVYVATKGAEYLGAILQRDSDWWLPVAVPKRIDEAMIGLRDVRKQINLLAYLAR